MTKIKVIHFLEVEKEAFFFNNLVDFSDSNEIEYSFVTMASEGGFTESMKNRDQKVIALDSMSKTQFPSMTRKFSQILKEQNPDIVHTHLFNPTYIGLKLAKRQNRGTVVTRHHSDALHLLPSKLKRSFYLKLENQNNRRADHIIAPSRMVRECIVDWEKTPSKKVSIVPYGQTHERFDEITPEMAKQKRVELGMDKQLSLLCISRLFHRKGHEYLFKALAPLIKDGLDVKLFLAGNGEYESTLRKMTKELEIEQNVEFLGFREDILELMAASDIVVHPSLEDALSQSLIESLMMQSPIVATDISGAADTLDGGKYGKLVEPANPESLRKGLVEMIDNLELARENATKGKAFLLEYMSAARVADEHLSIYRKVLGR